MAEIASHGSVEEAAVDMRATNLAGRVDLRQGGAGDRLELELRRHETMTGRFQIRIVEERLMHQAVQSIGVKELIPVLGNVAAVRQRSRPIRSEVSLAHNPKQPERPAAEVRSHGAGSGCDSGERTDQEKAHCVHVRGTSFERSSVELPRVRPAVSGSRVADGGCRADWMPHSAASEGVESWRCILHAQQQTLEQRNQRIDFRLGIRRDELIEQVDHEPAFRRAPRDDLPV